MAITIPLRNDLPRFDFQIDLEGTTYTLDFVWNFRGEYWSMSLLDADGLPLVYGIAFLIGTALGKRHPGEGMPPGILEVLDTSGQQRDAGLNDLGSRVILLYHSAAELAAG